MSDLQTELAALAERLRAGERASGMAFDSSRRSDNFAAGQRQVFQFVAGELRDLLAAYPKPVGVERVEWGVQCSQGVYRAGLEFDARLDLASDKHHDTCVGGRVLIRRTVTTYEPVVGAWEVVGDE